MQFNTPKLLAGLLLASGAIVSPAFAQALKENALNQAEDAFGTNVGLESTGIYTEYETRGFSPLDAGNVRIDGIYFDQVANLTSKLRDRTAMRVGFSAVDTPFVAPTGIVDHQLKPFPIKAGNTLTYNSYYYGGRFGEWEYRLPLLDDRLGLTGGVGVSKIGQADGADSTSWGVTFRAIGRIGSFEISPYIAGGQYSRVDAKPIVAVTSGYRPKIPPRRKYLGQPWVRGKKIHQNLGLTVKGAITDDLSIRAGIFRSSGDRDSNFTEIYNVQDGNGLSGHYIYADPAHDIHSTSGEALLVWRLGGQSNSHRFFAGYRGRERLTETGGSDFFNLGAIVHGQIKHVPRPEFEFGPVNRGLVRQSSWMFGYVGNFEGLGRVNLGVQKARYRGSQRHGDTQVVDLSRADPWLYNAGLLVQIAPSLSAYLATQRGLEDSGIASEHAANRNEQLPATKSTQYEGGLRWKFGKGQVVVSAFQITKPYFSYDANRYFVVLGQERHRGAEVSVSANFFTRFNVLLGAVMMDPEVTGPGRDAGLVGSRPTGVPKVFVRADTSYRTDLPGNLTFTASIEYKGSNPATAAPIDHLGDRQLMVPSFVSLDLGARQSFRINKVPVSLRVLMQNVFDKGGWHVPAPDVLLPKYRRGVLAVLAVDF